MGRMTFKKMLILGTLVGAGVGAYMLLTKRVPELPGMPKGSMSLAVTPSAGGQYKRVKVTATVQATEGTTPISLNGTITVYDQTFGTEVETKTWTDTIYDLSMKSTYYFEFDGIAGHTYKIDAKVVLKNNAGSKTLTASKTVTLPAPTVPPAGTVTLSVTYY